MVLGLVLVLLLLHRRMHTLQIVVSTIIIGAQHLETQRS